ncbi:MAG: ECF-type sigma factor [Verrucomicrobiota bacterium]|nr:ECF-type sigma factor [Verrucomicrobiota bacterium]
MSDSAASGIDPTEARFLAGLNGGGGDALAAGMPAVYEELRQLAAHYLRDERSSHTLQPTALVHEAYLRLLDQHQIDATNREQLLGLAARMMRRILTNHAIARTAEKRGGRDAVRLSLDDALEFYEHRDVGVIAVDGALKELALLDAQQAEIVELRFFGGLTVEQIAKVLVISEAKVKREWATAKLWLKVHLSDAS